MKSIEQAVETLKRNFDKAQKFYEIEKAILSILNFQDFLEKLLAEIKEKRKVHYVWISIIDNSALASIMQQAVTAEVLAKTQTNLIDRDTFCNLIKNEPDPILVSDNLKLFHSLLPEKYRHVRSLAVVPLTLDGEIVGSINHADESKTRYLPGMDTTLLKRLSTIVSICLSNVTAHEKLNALASRDPLTGLLNRRVLEQTLNYEFDRSKRYGDPLSIAFIDVDDFKGVNDTLGHKTGDELLRYIAGKMLNLTRGSDVVARYAGDEFVIILTNTPAVNAIEFKTRLQSFFAANPMQHGDTTIPVSVSCGLAYMDNGDSSAYADAKSFLQKADTMLYEDKKGKGTRCAG